MTLAAAGLAATALLGAACLRSRTFAGFVLAAYLLAAAEVVVLAETLSLPRWIGATGFGVAEAVLFIAALAVWTMHRRPLPSLPVVRGSQLRAHPVLLALGCVVACALAYEAFLAVATPPNNWDSMTYHLVRAVEWLQRGRVGYVPQPATERVNALQPNAEIEVLYTFAFLHRDTLAALPQLTAELASLVAVYGIARRLAFRPAPAALAALLTATLTEVALESVTTQNDLVAASFVAACAYFLLGDGLVDDGLAGLAFAIAVGTKLTAVFALPALVLLRLSRGGVRGLARVALTVTVSFVFVGAYGYALNLVHTGSPLTHDLHREVAPAPSGVGEVARTFGHVFYRFVDLSGYGDAAGSRAAAKVLRPLGVSPVQARDSVGRLDSRGSSSVDEDTSFFGPLGVLLVLPLVAVFGIAFVRRRASPAEAALATAVPTYALLLAVTYTYNVWVGRFMIAPVLLTMPLAAAVYRWRVVAAATALVGLATVLFASAFNVLKPTGLSGSTPVWDLPRSEAQTARRKPLAPVVATVDRVVPLHAVLGRSIGEDDPSYPFYGRSFGRRLVPLPARGVLLAADRLGLDWVVSSRPVSIPRTGPRWVATRFPHVSWVLVHRR
jgi:hypothetical protein